MELAIQVALFTVDVSISGPAMAEAIQVAFDPTANTPYTAELYLIMKTMKNPPLPHHCILFGANGYSSNQLIIQIHNLLQRHTSTTT